MLVHEVLGTVYTRLAGAMSSRARLATSAARALPLCLAAMLLLAACAREAPPPPPPPRAVGVVTIQSQPVELTAELPGRVAAVETSEVRPQVNGIVRQRLFEEGTQVRAGQVLYVLEDAPYRAAVAAAEGELAGATATIESTRLQSQRYRELASVNAVSKQEADDARAASLQAAANAEARRGNLARARVDLEFTRIRAPITGRIGRSLVTVGALVQNGQAAPLATIARTDPVYVDVTQSAAQLLDLRQALAGGTLTREGPDSARVRLLLPNGSTYAREGVLRFSEVTVEPATGTVTLRASFPNPDGLLLPGMYVRAQLVEGVRTNAVLAPQQGITRDPRGRGLALVVGAGNKVERRQVDVGRSYGGAWIVNEGLRPGDRLIVEGGMRLQPGTEVRAVPPEQITVPRAGRVPSGESGTAPVGGSDHSPDAAPGTASDDRRN
jgi:membrane fusion protein (multidrug efflux system)